MIQKETTDYGKIAYQKTLELEREVKRLNREVLNAILLKNEMEYVKSGAAGFNPNEK